MHSLPGQLTLGGCSLRYSDSVDAADDGTDEAERADASEPGSGTGADADAVVLLHGAGADHTMFRRQADALRRAGLRVVLVDLRGHGASRPNSTDLSPELLASDVERLIAHLGLGRVSLLGHSLGGNLAQELVRRSPERFRSLVVLDSTWNAGPLGFLERAGLRAAAPILQLIPARNLPKLMADASAVTATARAELTRMFGAMSKREFVAVWRATTQFVRPTPGYRTPVPTLLVRGASDSTGNIARAMPAWAAADGLTELVVDGAGHVVTLDAPDEVSVALVEFLGS
ncbi:alpha/beta fold hydrolase [Pseudoclavibacter sp. VKM Ac-2867]|uniref:alpha/beta fold hydrolase n=1 Tax=Pseudoclavibacter sp. VKM Ac-2867 TaxID=2783829 RepID=UPI00188C0A46|nr:alpha/beta hydrolase [Pseudoclavibacter sp. VKM Ac-2867]MBF4459038.1 alpha/beta hydrolase [Pseudoclavibacter sp. VKM Ac-2867]